MAILNTFEKQPSERKDYDVTYAEWLAPEADTLDDIETSVECLTSDDASLVVDTVDMTTTTAKLWMTGGADGNKYKVTIKATTVGGRLDESELVFKVKDR